MIFRLIILTVFVMAKESFSGEDSLFTVFAQAAKEYNTVTLEAVALSAHNADSTGENASLLLLRGLAAWRLELIAFCKGDKKGIKRHGITALDMLERAEAAGADGYLAGSHRALVCQLLATLGIAGATKYGPKVASELKKAKNSKPDGYYSLLVEAINLNQAPSFAGGDVKKAVEKLKMLQKQFPDSNDVATHLADAYWKNERLSEARTTIARVRASNPADLLAKKVAEKIEKP